MWALGSGKPLHNNNSYKVTHHLMSINCFLETGSLRKQHNETFKQLNDINKCFIPTVYFWSQKLAWNQNIPNALLTNYFLLCPWWGKWKEYGLERREWMEKKEKCFSPHFPHIHTHKSYLLLCKYYNTHMNTFCIYQNACFSYPRKAGYDLLILSTAILIKSIWFIHPIF